MIQRLRSRFLTAIILVIALFFSFYPIGSNTSSAAPAGFVTASGGKFMLNGSSFYFAGTNNYYMHYKSQLMVDDIYSSMVSMNLKVLRLWGFLDGNTQVGVDMQPSPGVYSESGFVKMDYAIYKAGQLGIKLVIPFVNNWDDFGGMNQYVKWFNAGSHDAFYTNAQVKQAYKNYINYMLNRTNTYNGIKYKDDPAIMTWELANEPRAQSDRTGNTLVNWASEMSTYIKSLDANHLVAVGDEGFYNKSGNSDYPYGGGEGVDWLRLIALPNIDYGTYHLYPSGWGETSQWGNQWITDHINDGARAGKPVVLEEYGIADQSTRDSVYQSWLGIVNQLGGAGSQFWILTGKEDNGQLYPDYDGFRIVYPSATATLISNHAQVMNAKGGGTTQVPAAPTGVTATAGNAQVALSWTASSGATSYTVKRATTSGGTYTNVATGVTATSYTNTGLTNGTTYYYVVSASNSAGSSGNSAQVSATPTAGVTIPAAPTGLTATAGNAQVALSWTASSGATSYTVKRATTSGGPYTNVATGVTATSYTNTGLTNGTTYYYVVSASNSAGSSGNSVQVSATPQATVASNLTVQYKTNSSSATANQIMAQFNIKNSGTSAVSMSTLKLRYYFTKDSSSALSFWSDYAQIGSGNVQGTFVTMSTPKTTADTYLEISFATGAGSIAANGQSGEIQSRFAKTDWSNFTLTNDYSYDGTKTAFVDWSKVTLYQNGTLVWGTEP
ncbi:MAG: cellulose binding domain-containing protein [Candidatus Cohnella colombiensis]|uniref:Cellulose binding domain-containing protein n=1 Tax=Candidatus Cohnella colombiensis TaxID=3121368 RepID=A0AA95F105_9BACL|nr:MAG: cellulose binding domain-containing protein [Cohnella sp.]